MVAQRGFPVRLLFAVSAAALLLLSCSSSESRSAFEVEAPKAAGALPPPSCGAGVPPAQCWPDLVTTPDDRLPDPQVETSGGGPLSDDQAAYARIQTQLPSIGNYYVLNDDEALLYAGRIAQFIPAVAAPFTYFQKASTCVLNNGVIAARMFVEPGLTEALGVLVVSGQQLQNLPMIAAKCIGSSVLGGGAGGAFNPCYEQFYYDAISAGVVDRYYVFVAGTNNNCGRVTDSYSQYEPTPLEL